MLNNAADVGAQMMVPIAIMFLQQQKQQFMQDLMLEFIQVKDLGKTPLDHLALQ